MADKYKSLRDMIGKHESPGGIYDVEYGGGSLDLKNMTIRQVLAHQRAQKQAGVKSTAVGRYQFINKTLDEIVRRNPKDFPLDKKFDAETQDRLADILIERRYKRAMSTSGGVYDRTGFAKEISKEWASMPNPSTGKSYYDGDGLNSSGISVHDFMKGIPK